MEKESEKLKRLAAEEENDMKAWALRIKSLRAGNLEKFREHILPKLNEKHEIKEFAPNSFRILTGAGKIDYYPAKGRLFVHKKQKWDTVRVDYFLDRFFAEVSGKSCDVFFVEKTNSGYKFKFVEKESEIIFNVSEAMYESMKNHFIDK